MRLRHISGIACALLLLLTCTGQAQVVQSNGDNTGNLPSYVVHGDDIHKEGMPEIFSPTSHQRVPTNLRRGIDPVRIRDTMNHLPDKKFMPAGFQRNYRPQNAMVFLQSQIYVIDTAIVRSTADTTRHLYSFNAKAKRTCDLAQKLTGDVWVDTLRQTNTYDANGHMLTDLHDRALNGQWQNEWRETWTYDANGHMLTDLFEGLAYKERYTYTYDANGYMLTDLYEHWSNGQWMNQSRQAYTYDANGNRLTAFGESWSNGQWVNGYRNTRTYDANGHMLTDLYEHWSNGQWVNYCRSIYTYDANGNMLTCLVQNWSGVQWVNYYRSTYTYDANGNILSCSGEDWWLVQWGHWVNRDRYTYTYDANGNTLTYSEEYWGIDQWVNHYRVTWTYDANGNMLTALSEYDFRHTFTYDANGNRLTELYEEWTNGQWVYVERYTYIYDAQAQLTSFWHYHWLDSSWTPTYYYHGRGGFVVFDSAGNYYEFKPAYNYTFTRRLIMTGVAADKGNIPVNYSLSQNYPNPFNPTTTIEYQLSTHSHVTLKVFDMLGRGIITLADGVQPAGEYKSVWNAESYPSGVYFYRLQAGSFTETKKLVLIR